MRTRARHDGDGEDGGELPQSEATPVDPDGSETVSRQALAMPEVARSGVDGAAPAPEGAAYEYAAGAVLGRYVILEHIATGGMGEVYKAHDPDLDRQVALKLLSLRGLSPRARPGQRQRLLREAQALAQLSHPNVVAVHDVGAVRDQVFVAMELIAGVSVRDWLRAAPRSRAEVVRMFVAAGRGLAAAHRAGLVHRDVKPSNIMVGDDGRVRVVDFGLARGAVDDSIDASAERSSEGSGDSEPSRRSNRLDAPLTAAGAVLGTPSYMAPEQRLGRPLDARADQYAFCVSLCEALSGERADSASGAPFRRELAALPRRLRRILRTGLSSRPENRFPSMDALLSALARESWTRRARWWGAAAAMACAAALATALATDGRADDACEAGRLLIDATWNDRRKADVGAAIATSGHPFPRASTDAIGRQLDAFVAAWQAVYVDACAATHRRGEAPIRLLEMRTDCLERRRDQIGELVTMLAEAPSPKLIDRAARAVAQLSELSECDADAVLAAIPPPTEVERRDRARRARAALDRAELLQRIGYYEAAVTAATRGLEHARASGHIATEAAALLRLGVAQVNLDLLDEAESNLRASLAAAATARDLQAVARGWIELVGLLGVVRARDDDAEQLGHAAEVALAVAGAPAQLRGMLERDRGAIAIRRGNYEAAQRHFQRYAELVAERYPSGHIAHAAPLNNLGAAAFELGQLDTARDCFERAAAITEANFGPHHPALAPIFVNLGLLLHEQGRFEAAFEALQRATAIEEVALGPDHHGMGMSRGALGATLLELDRVDEAIEQLTAARDAIAASLGPEHYLVSYSLGQLGEAYRRLGELDRAEAHLQQAFEIRAAAVGANHADVAELRVALAELHRARGELAAARGEYRAAIASMEAALGGESLRLGWTLAGLGRLEQAVGDRGAAIPALERALAILDAKRAAGEATAATRFALAQALWESEPERARELARVALESSAKDRTRAAAVRGWLASRERLRTPIGP